MTEDRIALYAAVPGRATIEFEYTGGRNKGDAFGSPASPFVARPLVFEIGGVDVRMITLLGHLEVGHRYRVNVLFLRPDRSRRLLRVGDGFWILGFHMSEGSGTLVAWDPPPPNALHDIG